MGMFSALVPQNDNIDLGTESYEEIVDNYCLALEDVEAEMAGLESLSDAIDNAEAFAAAIESCGGQVSPALMQFGYSVDPEFGALIGRECPSDFATEDMHEFGSFALESIQSKLKLAWEAVKDFIIRLWEKLKEFGRWVVGLFTKKEGRLEAVRKAAVDKKAKGREFKKADTRSVKCFTKDFTVKAANSANLVQGAKTAVAGIVAAATAVAAGAGTVSKADPKAAIQKAFEAHGSKITLGGIVLLSGANIGNIVMNRKFADECKSRTLQEAGYNGWEDIISACDACIKLLKDKKTFDDIAAELGKLSRECIKHAKDSAAVQADLDNDKADKMDRDDKIAADTAKRHAIVAFRQAAILGSRIDVAVGKVINNVCASTLAVAKTCGL